MAFEKDLGRAEHCRCASTTEKVFMKTMIRLGGAIAVCISLLVTAAVFAEGGFGGGHGGGGSGRFHGGYYGGYRGGWGPGIASGFGWPDSYDN